MDGCRQEGAKAAPPVLIFKAPEPTLTQATLTFPLVISPSTPAEEDQNQQNKGEDLLKDPIKDSQEDLIAYRKVKDIDPKGQGRVKGAKVTPSPPPKVNQPLTSKASKSTKCAGTGIAKSKG